jgi:Icc protein
MDKTYSLSNHRELWAVLKSIPRLPYIFCGHYHTEKVIIRDKRTVFIAPSAFMQIDPAAPGFKILSKRPGWRLIDWDGRKLQTSVIYL